MKIFVSYSRQDASIAAAIASDLRQLNHDVWFDHELTGGQEWWQKILEEIRECDLFAFVISTESLESQACMQEWEYASALAKRILPFLGGERVRTAVLPDALSKIHFVDYRTQDKHALLRLVKAVAGLPASAPLPASLPQPPAIPVSYLGRVAARIDMQDPLSPQEQSFLFLELERGVEDPKTRDDALELLVRLHNRGDLLAHVGRRVDQALAQHPRKRSKRVASTPIADETSRASKSHRNRKPSNWNTSAPVAAERAHAGSRIDQALARQPRKKPTHVASTSIAGEALLAPVLQISRKPSIRSNSAPSAAEKVHAVSRMDHALARQPRKKKKKSTRLASTSIAGEALVAPELQMNREPSFRSNSAPVPAEKPHVGSRIDQALARQPRKKSKRAATTPIADESSLASESQRKRKLSKRSATTPMPAENSIVAASPSAQAESAPAASTSIATESSLAPALPMKLLVAESIAIDDTASIEALLRSAMATGDHWVIACGEDRITIAKKGNELVATASFKRRGAKQAQTLQSIGWTIEGQFGKMLGAGAIILAGAATGGLALGLFGTKGGRELLFRNDASKTLKGHQLLEGAMLIGQAFRTLSSDARTLTATNHGATPPKSA